MLRVAIYSVPRSGSTWVGEIFNSHKNVIYKLQPLFSYAFKDRLNENSTKHEIDLFFDELALRKDDFLDQKEKKKKGIIPVFKKEKPFKYIVYKEVRYHHILKNLLEKDKEVKVIGLVRNPLSVVNSWLNAPREFRKDLGWKELEEWRFAKKKNLNKIEEFNGYEKWKEVTLLFEELKKTYPERFYILKYDELLRSTESKVKDLFKFCGLDFQNQTKHFLINSSNNDQSKEAYSVFRKNQVDDKWQKGLNKKICQEIIKDLSGTSLEIFLNKL